MVSELNLSRNRLSAIPSNGLKLLTRLETLRVSDNNLLSPSFGPEFVYLEVRAPYQLHRFLIPKECHHRFPSCGRLISGLCLRSCSCWPT